MSAPQYALPWPISADVQMTVQTMGQTTVRWEEKWS